MTDESHCSVCKTPRSELKGTLYPLPDGGIICVPCGLNATITGMKAVSFEKEIRYCVAKIKDIDAALTTEEKTALDHLLSKVRAHLTSQGKEKIEYIVVESNSPAYGKTWRALEKDEAK